jgi:serine/threonine protein kinase
MPAPDLSAEALLASNGSTDAAARARSSTTVDSSDPTLENLPRPFGKYELRSLLGRGGMGAVYLAHDPSLDRLVALKIPRPIAEEYFSWRDRFLAEAKAAAVIRHPNICPVHEIGEIGDQPYLTMPYLEGETLAARLKRIGKFSVAEAFELIGALAKAIGEAHQRGIVHRDLKPANVMIDHRGQPIIMDFGLAHRAAGADDLRLTLTGVAMGTPEYMPPEQAGGDYEAIGPASDVY